MNRGEFFKALVALFASTKLSTAINHPDITPPVKSNIKSITLDENLEENYKLDVFQTFHLLNMIGFFDLNLKDQIPFDMLFQKSVLEYNTNIETPIFYSGLPANMVKLIIPNPNYTNQEFHLLGTSIALLGHAGMGRIDHASAYISERGWYSNGDKGLDWYLGKKLRNHNEPTIINRKIKEDPSLRTTVQALYNFRHTAREIYIPTNNSKNIVL